MIKQKTDELLKSLDAELSRIYETRDILSGRVCKDYFKSYEAVVSFPSSMGERGFHFQFYYESVPKPEEIYRDFRKELKEYVKSNSGFSGAYKDKAATIGRKVLRK